MITPVTMVTRDIGMDVIMILRRKVSIYVKHMTSFHILGDLYSP